MCTCLCLVPVSVLACVRVRVRVLQSSRASREDAGHRSGGGAHLPRRLPLRAAAPHLAEAARRGADVADPLLSRGRRAQEKL